MTQRKRWLKTASSKRVWVCRRETAWESRYSRNAKRSPFVCVLVWVYFVHERFESGFRDLTLCVKFYVVAELVCSLHKRSCEDLACLCASCVCAWFQGSGCVLRLTVVCLTPRCQKCLNQDNFFSSSVADVALMARSLHVSKQTKLCTRTKSP